MIVGHTDFLIKPKRKTAEVLSPKEVTPLTDSLSHEFDSLSNKRPLNNNRNDLSFKGSFLYADAGKHVSKELLEFTDKYLGHMGRDLFEHVKASDLKMAKEMFKFDEATGEIIFSKKSIPHLIGDGLILKNLPTNIMNGTVALLGKIKPLENWSKRTYNSQWMKKSRAESKIEAQINTLRGIAEFRKKLIKDGKTEEEIATAMFKQKMKMFDPKTGNYDTKHERSLNRIVSGIPPAIFLANDAYNLSRMMDDDKDKANKEKKTRFRQEISRIGINAYITLITFGALQKLMNNSNLGIMLTTGLTALFTESVSRLSNGKHITRLTPEEARAENLRNNAPEKNIKPVKTFQANPDNKVRDNKNQQKPLLSFDTIAKASAGVIVAGFGLKYLRKVKAVDNAINAAFKPFKNLYNKLTTTANYKVSEEEFNKIVKALKDNGFENDIAQDYARVGAYVRNADGTLSLGARDKKVKPLVNFVIAPFKFAWNTVTLPYRLVDKGIKSFTKKPDLVKLAINDKETLKVIAQNMQKDAKMTAEQASKIDEFVAALKKKTPKELTELERSFLCRVQDAESLAKSIDNIGKQALKKDFDPKEFRDYVCDNLLKSFNVDTMSNVSNAELSNLAKTAATAATLWFLMTDNYNMVMLKSNGNDVNGAQTKFKERFVQEGSRLFYQTLLIDLFNSTFRSQYNKSLFGMTWITLTNTTLGEWLTRVSVGVPVGAHTRDELLAQEERIDGETGFKKAYFNFMQRLTGKRSIKSYDVRKIDDKSAGDAVSSDKPSQNISMTSFRNISK